MKKLLFSNILMVIIGLLSYSTYAQEIDLTDTTLIKPPYRLSSNIPTRMPTAQLTPLLVKKAYGFSNVYFQGKGQTIAIVDAYDHPAIESDLAVFDNNFGLPSCTTANGCFSKVYASTVPPVNINWGFEIALDVEWAHAIAPEAKILLVEAANSSYISMMQAVQVAISRGATVVSMSWGGPEFSTERSFDSYFNSLAALNISFVASSGDYGHGVMYPSSSPFVLGVGGTTLNVDATGNYISEVAWSGSGGGISMFESEPSYQLTYKLPQNPQNMRGVPDVAYNGDPNTPFPVYFSLAGGWFGVGGTSAGAPQWAALIAIANSGRSNNLGHNVNNIIYALAALSNYNVWYNDITIGSNGSCGFICNAQIGYDYITGVGTPKAQNLIPGLIAY